MLLPRSCLGTRVGLITALLLLFFNYVATATDNMYSTNTDSKSERSSNFETSHNFAIVTSSPLTTLTTTPAAAGARATNVSTLLPNVATLQEVNNSTGHSLRRGKRYLDFLKGSRISWRASVKNNIVEVNTLWAYGVGLRANFPFPDKNDRRRPFFKRDVLHSLSDVLNGHGLDGQACILKSYCTAMLDVGTNIEGGMLFKLLKLIFSLDANEKRQFPYLRMENCHQLLHSHCPLSYSSISPYTDDV